MNYDTLKEHVDKNLSSHKIAKVLNMSQTTIRYWLKKYNLKTTPNRNYVKDGYKTCSKCKIKKELNTENFYLKKNGEMNHRYCRKCNTQIKVENQRKRKYEAIIYKGGKCCKCGYSKCLGALEFHHINPLDKDFNISRFISKNNDIKSELDKCLLVCANCHREIHHLDCEMVNPARLD